MGDMDSGNSGSMQSSSTGGGDDQEYESSRADVTSFPPSLFNPTNYQVNPFDNARLLQLYSLNNGPSSSAGGIFDQQAQQQGHVHFDTTPNFVTGGGSTSHMDMVWTNKFGSIRSSDETTCTPTGTSTTPHGYNNTSASNPMSSSQAHLGPPRPSLPNLQGPAGAAGSGVPSTEISPRSSAQNQNAGGGRNPKKRSRASRRAPTTVLTTDTSNFRQMVQEFTGIPAPPFSGPGFSTRTRLDLFGGLGMGMGMGMGIGLGSGTGTVTGMGMGMGMGMGILPRPVPGGGGLGSSSTTNLDPPSYLLRPFAQKPVAHPATTLQPQQENTGATNNTTTSGTLPEATVGASSGSNTTTNNNVSAQNVLQPPNPMFAFQVQSLLQPSSNEPTSDKYPPPLMQQDSGMENLGSKGSGPGSSAVGGGPSGENEPQSWAGLHQGLGLTRTDHAHDHHHSLPSQQTNNSGMGNLSSSSGTDTSHSQRAGAPINGSSDNHGGVVRGEPGMVDSWICSSD